MVTPAVTHACFALPLPPPLGRCAQATRAEAPSPMSPSLAFHSITRLKNCEDRSVWHLSQRCTIHSTRPRLVCARVCHVQHLSPIGCSDVPKRVRPHLLLSNLSLDDCPIELWPCHPRSVCRLSSTRHWLHDVRRSCSRRARVAKWHPVGLSMLARYR